MTTSKISYSTTIGVNPNQTRQFELTGFGAPDPDKSLSKPRSNPSPSTRVKPVAKPVSEIPPKTGHERKEITSLRKVWAQIEANQLTSHQIAGLLEKSDHVILKQWKSATTPWKENERRVYAGIHAAIHGKAILLAKTGADWVTALESTLLATQPKTVQSSKSVMSKTSAFFMLNDKLHTVNKLFQKDGSLWHAKTVKKLEGLRKIIDGSNGKNGQLAILRQGKNAETLARHSNPSELRGFDMAQVRSPTGERIKEISPLALSRWLEGNLGLKVKPEDLRALNENRHLGNGNFPTVNTELLIPTSTVKNSAVAQSKRTAP